MKKILFVLLVVVIAASMVMAQAITKGNTAYIPATDVQGAHENGGRGCAGCHAPHSGGRGAGGQTNGTPAANGVVLGDSGLWGTDKIQFMKF